MMMQYIAHGVLARRRHAFRGFRNLLGCYLTADDWRSNLRMLRDATR